MKPGYFPIIRLRYWCCLECAIRSVFEPRRGSAMISSEATGRTYVYSNQGNQAVSSVRKRQLRGAALSRDRDVRGHYPGPQQRRREWRSDVEIRDSDGETSADSRVEMTFRLGAEAPCPRHTGIEPFDDFCCASKSRVISFPAASDRCDCVGGYGVCQLRCHRNAPGGRCATLIYREVYWTANARSRSKRQWFAPAPGAYCQPMA